MKKYFFLLLFLIPAGILIAQDKFEKEPYLTKSLASDNIKNVEATTSGGSISVESVNASEARIEVYLSPNNWPSTVSKEELKQRLEELYTLEISAINNKLTAIAKSKDKIRDWKKAVNISFKIFVPKNASTNLTTSGGSISLSNLAGTQIFSTSGGSLNVDGLSGKIDGRTSGGSINLKNSKDEIELTTSGGSINAKNCTGNLKLSTSGGSLNLNDLQGTIKATTSGGSIKGESIGGELITHTSGGSIDLSDLSCSLETGTSGGNIEVSFKQLGKYVRISNSAGGIDLTLPRNAKMDLDLSGKISHASFENFDGKIEDKYIKGKLNGGGVPVQADAGWGRIKVSFQ